MEGLLSILIFAGLFYFMMRFGCGAHMMHGHPVKDKVTADEYTDPVCGKPVETTQGYGKMHEKKLIRFCSRDCLDKFDAQPEQFIQAKISNGDRS